MTYFVWTSFDIKQWIEICDANGCGRKPKHRVTTDLQNLEKSGNLKETSESQWICYRIPKVREKSENFVVWNLFSAKLKIQILKIFCGSMPPDPLNGLGIMVELNLGLEKSGRSQGISYCLESGNHVNSKLFPFDSLILSYHWSGKLEIAITIMCC